MMGNYPQQPEIADYQTSQTIHGEGQFTVFAGRLCYQLKTIMWGYLYLLDLCFQAAYRVKNK